MFAKIIVGAAGLLVVAAGGYLYYQGNDSLSGRHCCTSRLGGTAAKMPSCCSQQPVSTSQDAAGSAETLTIMPREVAVE
jgi:hypothetical protein